MSENQSIVPEGQAEDKDQTENEPTISDLVNLVKEQQDIIAKQNTAIDSINKSVQDNYGSLKDDVQNLTDILGNAAAGDNTNQDIDDYGDYSDITDPKVIKDIVRSEIMEVNKEQTDTTTKEKKQYFDDYAEMSLQMLDEGLGPDGKPFTPEARQGILDLLKSDPAHTVIHTKSGVKDAVKNFNKAKKTFFGLGKGKVHGFNGEDVSGTGIAGDTSASGGRSKVTLTEESKKLLAELGETEEWGSKVLAGRV